MDANKNGLITPDGRFQYWRSTDRGVWRRDDMWAVGGESLAVLEEELPPDLVEMAAAVSCVTCWWYIPPATTERDGVVTVSGHGECGFDGVGELPCHKRA